MEFAKEILPFLMVLATIISAGVTYAYTTGRWTRGQEAGKTLMEERLKSVELSLGARVESLRETIAWRGAQADKEHAVFFARLDELDKVTSDLQRQIDRRKAGS